MKKKKYLPFYHHCMRTGELPYNGLCNCFGISVDESRWLPDRGFKDFALMFPDDDETHRYWGAGEHHDKEHIAFTTLRQTIVLLMAAINDEL